VTGPDGRDGLLFLTLEADSLLTVTAARAALGVPYRWASMQVDHRGDRVRYRSRRRGQTAVAHDITIETSGRPVEANELATWLTGRWRAWTPLAGGLAAVPVEHEPWPLTTGAVVELDETLLDDVGLPAPTGEPVVHYAAGVDARLGWPQIRRVHARNPIG
jgi:uncharacterized protein